MMGKNLVLFVSIFVMHAGAETYTSGSTKVEVEATIIDENNSTRKCVTYLTNPPEKYETACFTTAYTDGATFQGCTVQFDDSAEKRCDSCEACVDNDEQVGFIIDCDSLIPSKSNLNDGVPCTILNDMNIQTLLTDDSTFTSTPFDFTIDSTVVTDDSEEDNENRNKTGKDTSSGCVPVVYGYFVAAIVFALTFSAL